MKIDILLRTSEENMLIDVWNVDQSTHDLAQRIITLLSENPGRQLIIQARQEEIVRPRGEVDYFRRDAVVGDWSLSQ